MINKILKVYFCPFILLLFYSPRLSAQNCQLAQNLFIKADTTQNRDSIIVILDKIRPILQKCQSWDTLLNTYNMEFNFYYNQWDIVNAEKTLEEGLEYHQIISTDRMSGVYLYNSLGLLELWKSNNLKAMQAFQEAMQIFKKVKYPHIDYLFTLKNNLGFSYQQLGDFKLANFYYQEALNLIQGKKVFTDDFQKENNIWRQIKLYDNLARNYLYVGDFSSAQGELLKGLKLFKLPIQNKEISVYYGDFLIDLAVVSQNLNQLTVTKQYLQKAEPFLTSDLQRGNALKVAGQNDLQQNDYEKAKLKFQKALNVFKQHYGQKNSIVAQIYKSIGQCYRKMAKWQKAIHEYQKAINAVTDTTYYTENINDLPSKHQVLSNADLIEILKEKCVALQKLSNNKTDSLKYLQITLDHYKYIAKLSDRLRQNYQTEEAKIFLSAESNAYFEEAIKVAKQLFDLTGKEEYLEAAFFFCEKSKAVVLLDEIKLKEVEGLSVLPDSIIQKQLEIKIKVNNLEQSLFIEKRKPSPNTTQIDAYENQLLTSMQQRMELTKWINKNYPSYQPLTESQPVSVTEVREELLEKNQTLLEYFVGENQIYLFVISRKRFELFSIDIEADLTEIIRSLLDNRKMYEPDFIEKSYFLYEKLVKISQCQSQEDLFIVPDGILAFLPFEMLLTDTVEKHLPNKMAWMLKNHACGYAYSATILALQNKEKVKGASVLAIAPIFKNTSKELRQTSFELKAFDDIEHKKIVDQQASIANFKRLSKGFEVLHFSTHASAKDSITQQPTIDLFDGKIHLADFYVLQSKAHLAVLSACETGLGEVKTGEGVMSLSRGLSYSGIPSLVTTLWAVNDQSTAKIIRDFYIELNDGKDKIKALQEAKLKYLATAPEDLAVPNYWAAPILVGNTQSLNFEKKKWTQYNFLTVLTVLLSIIVIVGFFLLIYKSNKGYKL